MERRACSSACAAIGRRSGCSGGGWRGLFERRERHGRRHVHARGGSYRDHRLPVVDDIGCARDTGRIGSPQADRRAGVVRVRAGRQAAPHAGPDYRGRAQQHDARAAADAEPGAPARAGKPGQRQPGHAQGDHGDRRHLCRQGRLPRAGGDGDGAADRHVRRRGRQRGDRRPAFKV